MARNGRERVWQRVRRSVVYILLGLISNLLIAWSCAIVTIRPKFTTVEWTDAAKQACKSLVYEEVNTVGVTARSINHILYGGAVPVDDPFMPPLSEYGVTDWSLRWLRKEPIGFKVIPATIEAGWPLHTVAGVRYWGNHEEPGQHLIGLIEVRLPWKHDRQCAATLQAFSFWKTPRVFLPYRPFVLNSVVNSLFYAAIWLGIVSGLRALKYKWRMHRGRCPSCKYDLARDFSTGCPECGWRRESTPRPVSS